MERCARRRSVAILTKVLNLSSPGSVPTIRSSTPRTGQDRKGGPTICTTLGRRAFSAADSETKIADLEGR
jgi:hypothetical protein